jgi:hypothetical protein
MSEDTWLQLLSFESALINWFDQATVSGALILFAAVHCPCNDGGTHNAKQKKAILFID